MNNQIKQNAKLMEIIAKLKADNKRLVKSNNRFMVRDFNLKEEKKELKQQRNEAEIIAFDLIANRNDLVKKIEKKKYSKVHNLIRRRWNEALDSVINLIKQKGEK